MRVCAFKTLIGVKLPSATRAGSWTFQLFETPMRLDYYAGGENVENPRDHVAQIIAYENLDPIY